jgi:transposase-like protein
MVEAGSVANHYVYFWTDGIHVQARLEDNAQRSSSSARRPKATGNWSASSTACARARNPKDREALLAFYNFPAEHWKHLRTTYPIESTFATVGHRTAPLARQLDQVS